LENCDPTRVVAVMLTGMGYDGADAFTEIKKRGGRTIAESKASAVVFGMPAELIERGGASLVLPVEKVANQLNQWAGR
jgi:two-component system, chemotaxis family, protein-glutamate methylesterase/glutaminase